MKKYQYFIIQIVVIVVLVIFGILEVKRVTDTQIGHRQAINGGLRGAEGIPVIDLGGNYCQAGKTIHRRSNRKCYI